MSENRVRKQDILALALLALSFFLGVALLSFDAADPPSALVYPPRQQVHNVCGALGASVARALLSALGLGAYFAVLSLGVWAALLLSRRPLGDPTARLTGWLLTLVGLTTLSALALPQFSPGPIIGAGGYLGATGRGLLELYFATFGAYVLALSVTAGGLLLCTDYYLLRLSWVSLRLAVRMASRVMGRRWRAAATAAGVHAGGNAPAPEPRVKTSQAASKKVKDDLPTRSTIRQVEATAPALPAVDSARLTSSRPAASAAAASTPSEPDKADAAFRIRNRLTKKSERDRVLAQLDAANAREDQGEYELPPIDLLLDTEPFSVEAQEKEVREKARQLEHAFANFGFNIKVVEIETGPVISQYEVQLEAGLRLSKITSLADDLAVALRVPSVRVVAPIPGKNTVGIEIPNADRQLVRLREVMEEDLSKADKLRIPLYLGKDVSGNPMVVDLAKMPHLLIAGRTGTGKSVCLNAIIMSMLMTRRPDEVKMILIDPKGGVELMPYSRLPHLMHPVVSDAAKAEPILAWAVDKMEERYSLLMRAGVRHIDAFNQLPESELRQRLQPEDDEQWEQIPHRLPYILIVADEMADLMMTAPKEFESHIIRLAQKSRAVGIHLILATQKPTVDVITGLIKSNLPARICFQVASRTDSRVVLDEMGADRLLGNGDMLFLWPGTSTLLRGQGAFVDDQEIRNVVNFLATSEPQFVQELLELKPKLPAGATGPATGGSKDDLYDAAVEVVLREGRGSVSLLQRALGIGYGRAARLIDYMAEDGIVGAYNGSQARDVLISLAEWHARQGAEEEPPVPRRRNKVVMTLQEQDEEEQQDISRLGGGPVVPGPHVSQRKGRGAAASLPVDRRPLRGGGAMTADDDPVEDEILNADENDPDDRDFDHRQPADSSGSE